MPASLQIAGLTLSAENPAIIVPLVGESVDDLVAEARAAVEVGADVIEWRADHWLAARAAEAAAVGARDVADVMSQLRPITEVTPVLFTVRTVAEGGLGPSDSHYGALLEEVITQVGADAVDIEHRREGAQGLFDTARAHGVPTVASFHNFQATPPLEEICAILSQQETMGAAVAKVAVMPQDAEDVATLLAATARQAQTAGVPLITMSMAGAGAISRCAGHLFGSAATFGTTGRASAPGQIPVGDLKTLIAGLGQASTES
ncbi:type I 3-dehydroquinate dehydratase [Kocuria sp.]|uniref:type I 3-dehydroquinate dehydratase n=1 Tax=Kocuria sp. TaxID=1871328 RepID=UPI0026DFCFDC|nr:type I 3-dehydroquinate dehydratase [Kocuria sp.]MDO5619636.1 type I 3-dehydroquinate dehydratase [Kocuria sp.]